MVLEKNGKYLQIVTLFASYKDKDILIIWDLVTSLIYKKIVMLFWVTDKKII